MIKHIHGEEASYYTIRDVLFKVQKYGLRKDMHCFIDVYKHMYFHFTVIE